MGAMTGVAYAPHANWPGRILPPAAPPGGRVWHPDVDRLAWIFAQALYRAETARQEQIAAPVRPRARRRKLDD
jgi:hypothetical protein